MFMHIKFNKWRSRITPTNSLEPISLLHLIQSTGLSACIGRRQNRQLKRGSPDNVGWKRVMPSVVVRLHGCRANWGQTAEAELARQKPYSLQTQTTNLRLDPVCNHFRLCIHGICIHGRSVSVICASAMSLQVSIWTALSCFCSLITLKVGLG